MELSSVTFKHPDVKMEIAGFDMKIDCVRLSYDRSGNILIGMDVLKKWDIHIGMCGDGETVFLGCPREQLNERYYLELAKVFGINKI